MKAMLSAIKASALSLILLTSGACVHAQNLSESKNSTQPQVQQVSDTAIAANSYKPGINRVTFQSEGETMVIPQWANQFAVMSWAEWLTFSAMPQAKQIKVPTLFIHSEKAAIPDGARQFFAAIPAITKI